jgi:ribosome-associated heat shock protein Hsp15
VSEPAEEVAAVAIEPERLDVWLDVACLFKTRSEAQRACRGGKVDLNGQAARPNRTVRPGDQIVITRGGGRRQSVVVRGTAPHHIPKADARKLYEDRTPPPSPEEIEIRRIDRAMRAADPPGAPHRRDRRLLRRLKGRSE